MIIKWHASNSIQNYRMPFIFTYLSLSSFSLITMECTYLILLQCWWWRVLYGIQQHTNTWWMVFICNLFFKCLQFWFLMHKQDHNGVFWIVTLDSTYSQIIHAFYSKKKMGWHFTSCTTTFVFRRLRFIASLSPHCQAMDLELYYFSSMT